MKSSRQFGMLALGLLASLGLILPVRHLGEAPAPTVVAQVGYWGTVAIREATEVTVQAVFLGGVELRGTHADAIFATLPGGTEIAWPRLLANSVGVRLIGGWNPYDWGQGVPVFSPEVALEPGIAGSLAQQIYEDLQTPTSPPVSLCLTPWKYSHVLTFRHGEVSANILVPRGNCESLAVCQTNGRTWRFQSALCDSIRSLCEELAPTPPWVGF